MKGTLSEYQHRPSRRAKSCKRDVKNVDAVLCGANNTIAGGGPCSVAFTPQGTRAGSDLAAAPALTRCGSIARRRWPTRGVRRAGGVGGGEGSAAGDSGAERTPCTRDSVANTRLLDASTRATPQPIASTVAARDVADGRMRARPPLARLLHHLGLRNYTRYTRHGRPSGRGA